MDSAYLNEKDDVIGDLMKMRKCEKLITTIFSLKLTNIYFKIKINISVYVIVAFYIKLSIHITNH
jgi:hypothetical protein